MEERNELDAASAQVDPAKGLVPQLGILDVEIDQQIAASATGLSDPFGIIVVARAAGAASDLPLQPRDIIRRVNARLTVTLLALKDALGGSTPGSPVTLQIQREGRLMYISFTLE